MKLISIVIPTFNCGEFLPETIKSLQDQTYSNWEAICVDDGSSDNTLEVANKLSAEDKRVRVYSREELPKGGSHCRNIGVQHASGDYVIFLDGDDLLVPTCLENRLKQIENTNYDFAVFSMGTMRNGVIGKVITDSRIKKYRLAFASNHAVWQVTSPIYRTEFVRSINGFDTNFLRMQDLEFGLRAIAKSNDNFLICIDDNNPDCYYRLSDGVVTAKKYITGLQQFDKFVCLLHKLEEEGSFPDKKELSTIYLCLALSSLIVYLRKGVYDTVDFKTVFHSYSVTEKLSFSDRIVYGIIQLLSPIKRLQFIAVRALRRLIMNNRF